jgi:hypothetical protein
MPKLGPTGKFPHGKLDQSDEGGLTIAIGSQLDPGSNDTVVRVEFGKKVAWIGLPSKQAIEFALTIMKHAGVKVTMEEIGHAGDSGKGGQSH